MTFIYYNHDRVAEKRLKKTVFPSGDTVFVCPTPWDGFQNRIVKTVCHAHLSSQINDRFPLPFRSAWKKTLTKRLDCTGLCLILCSHFFTISDSGLLAYVRGNGGYAVFELTDRYDYFAGHYRHFPSAEQLRRDYDLVITYNVHDAKKYGFTLMRPRMRDYSTVALDDTLPESDVFFVGNNKGRLDELLKIFEFCTSRGLQCEFHINGVEEGEKKYADRISYNEPIPYSEVLSRVKRTKCVLNLVQQNGFGITLRDYEALSLGKYLLTNNYAIKETELYNGDQIIWLDEMETRLEEIKQHEPPVVNYYEMFNDRQWYHWLSELLEQKRGSL